MLFKHSAVLLLLVTALSAGALPRGNDSVQAFQQTPAVIGEIACFSARDAGGVNLWCTEGTAETTRRVTSLGPEDQILHQPVAGGGRVYFIVTSGPLLTLWQSDGTIGGTSAVAPLGQVRITSAQAHRGQFFFTTYEDGAGSYSPHQLWRSDGTAAGTQAFTELPRATRLGLSAGDFLYLVVGDQATSTLWRTDGSVAGTIPLDVPAGSFFATAGTTLLFESANQLWRSDGSVAGTDAIAPDRPVSAAVLGGTTYVLLLGSGSGNGNYRLIRTDGTYTGSAAIYTGEGVVSDLVATSERLFFFVHAGYNMDLWISSGTYETTHQALQLPHFAFGWSFSPVAAGNLLYYTHHHTFWRTDGTAAGTYPLQERWGRYDVGRPVRFGERVLISIDDGVHGVEPWISGGTVETTSLVANIHDEAVFRGRVIDAATGAAIPKARVEVLWEHGNTHFPADDQGRFVIEGVRDGTYHLRAHGGTGSVPQLWRGRNEYLTLAHAEPVEAVAGSRLDFDFALERSVTVSGRVLDASGKPPGANVVVVVAPWVGGPAYTYAYARRDGTYVTSGAIPPREPFVVYTTNDRGYSMAVHAGIECAGGCDRNTPATQLIAGAGETIGGIDFVVKRWGRVRGRLLDAVTGEAVETPVRVSTQPYGRSAIRTSRRDYELTLLDGRYRLHVAASTQYAEMTGTEEIVPIPGETTVRDIRLIPLGGRITGRVVDASSGAPLGGLAVYVRDAASVLRATGATRDDGMYVTRPFLPPGTYTVETGESPTHVKASERQTVTIAATDIVRADFALGRFASIRGVVRDAVTRQPLDDATVTLTTADGLSSGSRVETDAQGRFAFESLVPGDYLVTAVKTGWEKSAPSPIRVGFLGAIAEVDLRLGAACATAPTKSVVKFTAAGGSVRVGLGATCARCAFRTEAFVEVSRSCSASDAVVIAVGKNRGRARKGLVVLPGKTIDVEQD